MKEMTRNPDGKGENHDLTVMSIDLRKLELPSEISIAVADLMVKYRGKLCQNTGSAMTAFWDAPLDACLAALKINDAFAHALSNNGIGIDTGLCTVAGNEGSRLCPDNYALGSLVVLASHLGSLTKTYGMNIVVGETTHLRLPKMAMLELDLLRVKDRKKPLRIFTLIGDEVSGIQADFILWQAAHNGMLAAYRAADFGCAAQELKTARDAAHGKLTACYDLYAARIAAFVRTPPRADWGGVTNADEK